MTDYVAISILSYLGLGIVTMFVLMVIRRKGGIKDALGFLDVLVTDLSFTWLLWLAMLLWPVFAVALIMHRDKNKKPIQPPEPTAPSGRGSS